MLQRSNIAAEVAKPERAAAHVSNGCEAAVRARPVQRQVSESEFDRILRRVEANNNRQTYNHPSGHEFLRSRGPSRSLH